MLSYRDILTKSSHNTLQIKIPGPGVKLAEFLGIMFGDGSSYRREIGTKIRDYQIRIAGHLIDDKEYLTRFVKPLAKNLFGLEGQISPIMIKELRGYILNLIVNYYLTF